MVALPANWQTVTVQVFARVPMSTGGVVGGLRQDADWLHQSKRTKAFGVTIDKTIKSFLGSSLSVCPNKIANANATTIKVKAIESSIFLIGFLCRISLNRATLICKAERAADAIRASRPAHSGSSKSSNLQPNRRRKPAAFRMASRARRKHQRLRSNGLIESAAAGRHRHPGIRVGGTSDKS